VTDAKDDQAAIRELMAKWRRLSGEGDVEGLLALLTDDVVFLTPNNPPMDKQKFEQGFRSFAGKVSIDAQQEVKDLRVSGDLAYSWSYLRVTFTPHGGKQIVNEGNVLTVLRKEGGRWRIARDANLMPYAGNPDKK
jgi:uncharacterized protein (TIGR02246 family)